ncbi:MAG: DNA recombination/repair protein RecA, partial [Ruminiclostridium sp.]|nr:DNA recombination/repair protein RecA [Ruminiclostridium sp.]
MAKSSNSAKKAVVKATTPEEKKKALNAAIDIIIKQYGEGSIMIMGNQKAKLNVEAVSTGSLGLDLALGIGGLPKGRIVEIYGPESGGKTTVSLQAIAQVQKKGGIAAFIDVEHALDPVYARQ